MCTAGFPDTNANPGERGRDQIQDGAKHEHLKSAVPITESPKEDAKRAIRETENAPGDETGNEQAAGLAEITQHGNKCQRADDDGSREIAFDRNAVGKCNLIGQIYPSGQSERQACAHKQTDTNS